MKEAHRAIVDTARVYMGIYCSGIHNARKGDFLYGLFGGNEIRYTNFINLIVQNLPICGTTANGYYYPVTAEDFRAFEHEMKAKIFGHWKRLKRVADAFKGETGQLDLFDYREFEKELTARDD